MTDLSDLSLREAAALVRGRSVTSRDLTERALTRIAALDGRLRSFITVTADRALADADRADAELASGRPRGPLHGVPIAVKDLFDTAGIATTANSRTRADRVPARDATVVRRLADAGTVLLGKLQMNEFAMGPLYEDDFRPPARNPWDLERMPGGSSSGSGAALAARLIYGSYGSDTGGSIRGPAAYCGIVGLKPTQGLVSRAGVAMLSWSYDHVGPMARTVGDVAALLAATAGPDPLDPACSSGPVTDPVAGLDRGPRGIRIGAPRRLVSSVPDLEPDVAGAFDAALEQLQALGAVVTEVELPHIDLLDGIYSPVLLSEAAAYHQAELAARGDEYSRGFRRRVLEGFLYTGVEYVQAQRGRALFTHAFDELMRSVDVIATPTTHRTAPTFAEQATSARSPFTRIFNVTGQPSVSIPCGFDRSGLPIGLLLSGRRGEDAVVLRVANAYERATPWHARRPRLTEAVHA